MVKGQGVRVRVRRGGREQEHDIWEGNPVPAWGVQRRHTVTSIEFIDRN